MGLKAIRIIHNILTRIDFCFLAEFFRFAGIYVVECIEGDEDASPYQDTPGCYDATIDTCGSEKSAEGRCIDFKYIKYKLIRTDKSVIKKVRNFENGEDKSKPVVMSIHLWRGELQKKILEDIINDIYKIISIDSGAAWKSIIDAYVDNELTLHSMNLQYYAKKPSFAVENAQRAFYKAYRDLSKSEGEINTKYIDYAKLYSMVKVNATCKYMKQEYVFPIEELSEKCKQCIHRYPDFSNMKVLLGLCYEYEPKYAPWAIEAFDLALQSENTFCYSSHIFYWLGKQSERFKKEKSNRVIYYKESYEKKHKYRNMYKLAQLARERGDYEEAINWFQKIINKLKPKFAYKFADPLEMVYLFKSYAMIAIIYFHDLENYLSAMEYGEYLINSYNAFVDESAFYSEFYGDRAGEYIALTKSRFELNRVRSILYYSYQYLGLDEKQRNILQRK